MKKNKTTTIQKLIIKNLIIYIIVFLVGIWFSSKVTSMLAMRYFDKFSYSLNINNIDISTVSEDYLMENDSQILILDSSFNVIKEIGVPLVEKEYFSSVEVAELVANTNPQQTYYASFKPVLTAEALVISEAPPIYGNVGDENSGASATAMERSFSAPTATVPDEYLLLLQKDITSSEFDYSIIGIYMSANIALIVLLVMIVLFLFIRSIYKPLKANFETIENSLSRPLYDDTLVDISLATLEESQSVLSAYNSMVNALNYESAQKQRAVELNRQLIQNLAHDLKSPITVLKGYSEVLADDDVDSASQKEYISYIGKSANDLNNLVSLLFEQVTYQNSNNLNFEKADVNSILREVCANYYMIFDKRGFDFVSDISENSYVTSIDPVNIKRVFTNLLQNILNHNEAPTKVLVSSYKSDLDFVIKVMDDGIGIDNKNREKVFDAFFQEDSSRNNQNSGIGLYVVMQIIEKHGGTISLTSEESYKTVFTITLK